MKDQITTELERIAGELALTFVYGTINENNLTIDEVERDQYPLMVYLSTANESSEHKQNEAGLVVRTVPVLLFILDDAGKITTDYITSEVDPLLEDMRKIAARVVKRANSSLIADPTQPVTDWSTLKVFNKHDASLFGVSLVFRWNVIDSVTIC